MAPQVPLNLNSPRLNVPSKIPLFAHQQATLHAMVKSEKKRGVHILDDAPGTGKSFSILSLLLREKLKMQESSDALHPEPMNLLVIPLTIHQQWLAYIEKFSDALSVYSLMFLGDVNALHFDNSVLFEFDIIITTPSFFPIIADTVSALNLSFRRVIIDEIDSVSFYMDKAVPAQHVWLVSASAKSTDCGVYSQDVQKQSIRCEPDFIKQSITLKEPKVFVRECRDPFVNILQKVTFEQDKKPLYALNFLPYKFEHVSPRSIPDAKTLVARMFHDYCQSLNATNQLIMSLKHAARRNPVVKSSYDMHGRQKLVYEMKIEELLDLFEDSICPLCCNHHQDTVHKTGCCETGFCKTCISEWMSTGGCPVCTKPLEVSTQPHSGQPVPEATGKIEALNLVLREELRRERARILIFSEFPETFIPVRVLLEKMGVKYCELEGSQIQLDRNMNYYYTGKRPVMLIDAKNYGAGLNLHDTTAIIVMHKTDREEQIIGRANRCGRDLNIPLHVHKLLYPNE